MLNRKISLLGNVAVSVATSCIVYVLTILAAQKILDISAVHQAGYICAMLFVIPGFPLITGGIDLAKLDMRSGLERIAYALLIITAATLTGWATAWCSISSRQIFRTCSCPPSHGCCFALRQVSSAYTDSR